MDAAGSPVVQAVKVEPEIYELGTGTYDYTVRALIFEISV